MTEVAYGRYEEAFRAIHGALSGLTAPPPGRKVAKIGFSWYGDGSLQTLSFYDGADLLFTLTFTWNPDGTLAEVVRS